MEKVFTKEQQKETFESRWRHMLRLQADLKKWWIITDEEDKRMKSVLRAVNKYIEFLEEVEPEEDIELE